MHFTPSQWALLILGAFIIGLAKTGIAGLGTLAVALFANLLPARASTGFILPLLICADLVAVAVYKRHANWKHLWRLFPWASAGVVLGFFAMGHVSDRQVGSFIGALLILLVGMQYRRRGASLDSNVPHSLWFVACMGLLAGFTTMLANAAGPIMVIYLLAIGLPKMEFLGTAAWYFLILNSFKLPFSYGQGLITADSLWLDLKLAPFAVMGAIYGRMIIRHIKQTMFENLAQGLTVVAGLRLIWQAFFR